MSTKPPEENVLSALKWSLWKAGSVDEFFDLFKSLTSRFLNVEASASSLMRLKVKRSWQGSRPCC